MTTTLRVEAGFFAFYTLLGFCFICVPAEVVGTALDASFESLAIAIVCLTLGFATLLRVYTRDVVTHEVSRQSRIIRTEEWRQEFQESMK
ncbi:MAG: hypothetical protein OK439_02335 [Thaumarchaeota archaeon]|nr:hypothetical protein [Nitrososphaerota archaeon]